MPPRSNTTSVTPDSCAFLPTIAPRAAAPSTVAPLLPVALKSGPSVETPQIVLAGDVVDHLHVHVGVAARDAHAGTSRRTGDLSANATMATSQRSLLFLKLVHDNPFDLSRSRLAPSPCRPCRPCGGHARLIANALALVGLRLAPLADVRGNLADLLLGRTAHDDLGLAGHLERDVLGASTSTGWEKPSCISRSCP